MVCFCDFCVRCSEEKKLTPQVCYVCHEVIRPTKGENLVLCCEVCGVAVHPTCNKLRSDCKRCVSKAPSETMKHHFVLTCSAAEPERLCFVCQELCGGVGVRPIFRCVWCQELAHFDCIMEPMKTSSGDMKTTRQQTSGRLFKVASENGLHKRHNSLHKRSESLESLTETMRTSLNGDSSHAIVSESSHLANSCEQIWAHGICSMGRHNRLVIPPQAITVTAEADRRFHLGWGHATKVERQLTPISLSLYRSTDKFLSGQYWIESGGITFSDLPAGSRPLLVFINPASGPREGDDMVRRLRAVLNPVQVVVLSKTHGPEKALTLFKRVPNLRILVCGGDGTIGWVLSSITSIFGYNGTMPPVAVWPMGTGNDLARCLGWSNNSRFLRGANGLSQGLADVQGAALTLLDRWRITFVGEGGKAGSTSGLGSSIVKEMNNYVGIGIDAKVTLEFHSLRESYPEWFHSQMGNKLWYTGVGARGMIWNKLDMQSILSLECDGLPIEIPADVQGILILNVASYMGGVDVWGGSENESDIEEELFGRQRMNDGLIEVVGVGGPFHLGQLQVGLSQAQRLSQCTMVQIKLHKSIPVQIDGEPWEQAPCTVKVEHAGEVTMLRRLLKNKPKDQPDNGEHVPAALAEVLEEAHCTGLITAEARAGILAELIRRVEGDAS